MRYAYPCQLKPDEPAGSFSVTFPDIPEALTGGSSMGEAMENAQEALELAISSRLDNGEEIPEPSHTKPGEQLVPLAPAFAAKTALLLEMRRQDVQAGELQRRMGITETGIRDLTDPGKISPLERLTQALQVMQTAVVLEDVPETPGDHFRRPAGPGPMGYDEFIRRLRRYCTHRNIQWALLHNDDDHDNDNDNDNDNDDNKETDDSINVRMNNRIARLPQEEFSPKELADVQKYLRINPPEF